MTDLPFLDTNILLRHLRGDHVDHSPRATALIAAIEQGQERVRTADTVIFETVFTLERSYHRPHPEIASNLLPILELPGVVRDLLNGYRCYREQRGTRQHDGRPSTGRSIRCEVIDEQVGTLCNSLVLPRDWRGEIERRVADYDRVRSVGEERALLTERLRRLTTAYTMANLDDREYQHQQTEINMTVLGRRRRYGCRCGDLHERR